MKASLSLPSSSRCCFAYIIVASAAAYPHPSKCQEIAAPKTDLPLEVVAEHDAANGHGSSLVL